MCPLLLLLLLPIVKKQEMLERNVHAPCIRKAHMGHPLVAFLHNTSHLLCSRVRQVWHSCHRGWVDMEQVQVLDVHSILRSSSTTASSLRCCSVSVWRTV